MKLRPEDILNLLVNRHRFASQGSIIQFARLRNPWIEDSVETLTDTIQWALWERENIMVAEHGHRARYRRRYFPALGYFPRPWGGIVDYKTADTEQLRAIYSQDAGLTAQRTAQHGVETGRRISLVERGRLVATGQFSLIW